MTRTERGLDMVKRLAISLGAIAFVAAAMGTASAQTCAPIVVGPPPPCFCMQLPWVTADGQIMSFPTGTATTFTVAAAGSFPTCEHDLCIACGNPNATCPGIPGCATKTCAGGSRINHPCASDDT